MWGLPGPGLEPVSPALAGGFLTTAPPGKPQQPILELSECPWDHHAKNFCLEAAVLLVGKILAPLIPGHGGVYFPRKPSVVILAWVPPEADSEIKV